MIDAEFPGTYLKMNHTLIPITHILLKANTITLKKQGTSQVKTKTPLLNLKIENQMTFLQKTGEEV